MYQLLHLPRLHFKNYEIMTIKELKKELGLSNKDFADFFSLSYGSFANSSAKKRYEAALCKFYSFLKK